MVLRPQGSGASAGGGGERVHLWFRALLAQRTAGGEGRKLTGSGRTRTSEYAGVMSSHAAKPANPAPPAAMSVIAEAGTIFERGTVWAGRIQYCKRGRRQTQGCVESGPAADDGQVTWWVVGWMGGGGAPPKRSTKLKR